MEGTFLFYIIFSNLFDIIIFDNTQSVNTELMNDNEYYRQNKTVSFLTKRIQYTTLKLNFALRANVKKTAFPMIVYLQPSKKISQDLYLFSKFENFSRRSNLYNIGLKIPANYSMSFNEPLDYIIRTE